MLTEYNQKNKKKRKADLKQAGMESYKNKFQAVSNDAKKIWGVTKSLTENSNSQIPIAHSFFMVLNIMRLLLSTNLVRIF